MDACRAALFAVCLVSALSSPARAQSTASPAAEAPLTLADAQTSLETGNREIIAARRALDVAASGVIIAGARPNPTVSAEWTSTTPSSGLGAVRNKQFDSVLHVDQLVERGGKRELRIATADALVQAARRDLAEVRRQQRLALEIAYYDLKLAQEKLRIQNDTALLQQQSVNATQRRFEAGDAAESEVVRLRVEALRAANDARAAEADLIRARQDVAILIGQEGKAGALAAVDDWPAALPADAAAEPDPASIEARPDVRAAQARVDSAEQARELARRLLTRDVTVGAQVERLFPPDPGIGFGGTGYGVSFSVPLFLRYGFEGEVAQAEAQLTSAMAARDRQVLIASAEVRRARNEAVAAAERKRRLTEELLPRAKRAMDAAEFAYQRGATPLLDLLDARRTARAIELEAATAAADFAKARSALLASRTVDRP